MCKNIHPKTLVLGEPCESWGSGQLLPLQYFFQRYSDWRMKSLIIYVDKKIHKYITRRNMGGGALPCLNAC